MSHAQIQAALTMMTSDNDAEALNAMRTAQRLLKARGMPWGDAAATIVDQLPGEDNRHENEARLAAQNSERVRGHAPVPHTNEIPDYIGGIVRLTSIGKTGPSKQHPDGLPTAMFTVDVHGRIYGPIAAIGEAIVQILETLDGNYGTIKIHHPGKPGLPPLAVHALAGDVAYDDVDEDWLQNAN